MQEAFRSTLTKIITSLVAPIVEDYEIEVQREGDQWRVNIHTQKIELVIGQEGEYLKSLQHLIRVLVHKIHPEDRTHFILDVGGYRLNREQILKEKARQIAQEEVLAQGTTLILTGLNSYERKLIHSILSDIEGLETSSVGTEGSRKLIIRPTSETGSTGMDNAKVISFFENQFEQNS
jgi:spoIIIJ-associated protein